MQEIKSHIESEYEGAAGESKYELTNGQVWQQSRYLYFYHYRHRPQVTIKQETGGWVMYVEGAPKPIPVRRAD